MLYEKHYLTPNWRRLDAGGTPLTIICDGVATFDDLPELVGADQAPDVVEKLAEDVYLHSQHLRMGLNIPIVKIGLDLVVFDTGIGAMGRQGGTGLLASSLEAAGIKASEVTLVCLTHLHADHIAGLMENGSPLFPNARYVVGRAEYDYWVSPEATNGPRPETIGLVQKNLTPLTAAMTFVGDGDQVIGGLTAREAFGHSPGHMVYEVQTGAGPLLITGDALLHPVFSFEHHSWHQAFDDDHDKAAATRLRLLDELAERRIAFAAYHLPLPGVGYVARKGDSFKFVPTSYQFA